MTLKRFAVRRPIAAYVLLTFGLSYLAGLPLQWALRAWAPGLPEFMALYLGRAPVVLSPALAALFVAHASEGGAGVRRLLAGLRPRMEHWPWWMATTALSLGAAVAGYAYSAGADAPGRAVVEGWPLLLAHLVVQIGLVGIGEEVGWRGWLLPRLLASRSRAAATLLVAVVWTAWHFPILLSGGEMAVSFGAAAFALSVLFTALWCRTGGSTLAVAVAHGAFNAPLFFFEEAFGGAVALEAWYAVTALYVAAAGVLVAVSARWWLAKPEPAAAPA